MPCENDSYEQPGKQVEPNRRRSTSNQGLSVAGEGKVPLYVIYGPRIWSSITNMAGLNLRKFFPKNRREIRVFIAVSGVLRRLSTRLRSPSRGKIFPAHKKVSTACRELFLSRRSGGRLKMRSRAHQADRRCARSILRIGNSRPWARPGIG